jgi:hypothetical protein
MAPLILSSEQVARALPRVSVGLAKYTWLQSELPRRDVSRDPEFQRRFGGFYRVRRGADWRIAFYQLLEQSKSSPVSFIDALKSLHVSTGRVEASFASKLVATLDHDQPVIDSVVLGNLGLRLPASGSADRFAEIGGLHSQLRELFVSYLASDPGRELVGEFRCAYPDARVSEIKMLDLVLWQSR